MLPIIKMSLGQCSIFVTERTTTVNVYLTRPFGSREITITCSFLSLPKEKNFHGKPRYRKIKIAISGACDFLINSMLLKVILPNFVEFSHARQHVRLMQCEIKIMSV